MRLFSLLVVLLHSLAPAISQEKIEVSHIVDGSFSPKSVRGVNWMKDGAFYSALEDNKIKKFNVKTGEEVAVLVDGEALSLSIDDYFFSVNEDKVLLLTERQSIYRRSFTGIYYAYDVGAGELIGKVSGQRSSYATFSPVNNEVAYVQDNNLFITDLNGEGVPVTNDGEFNKIINGSTDWVYEEELYLTKAFEWSPDGQMVAYYKFDESEVNEYNMQVWNDAALYPRDYRYKYPKAGEANSTIEIWIYNKTTNTQVRADIGEEEDIYIPRIRWTNDNQLSVQRLNRLQNQLDLLHVNPESGESTLILSEQSESYIDFTFCDDLTYLENGDEFLMSSEKDGFKHFYLYTMDGDLKRQITQGNWEAESLSGLDQKRRTLYYISTENGPQERQLYSIQLDGSGKKQITQQPGWHTINMSGDTKFYMDYFTSSSSPLQVDLYETKKNSRVKTLVSNQDLENKTKQFGFAQKEFFKIQLPSGTPIDGFFLKPPDFSPEKKYPVLVYQYSGPGSQNVTNRWGGGSFVWHQMLAQKGYVVAVIDPRGTGGKGEAFKKLTYKQLGKYETEDHIEAAKYLASLAFVDASRIGIWGWSYGGYISSLALFRGADYFKTAISVAPVTTWRFYDTIYTERYLQRPQDNPEGYDDNSPLTHVEKLKSNFLLIHGTGDDNVHFSNSVALQAKLIEEDKQFSSFYYPDLAHSIYGGNARKHLFQMMTNFIQNNL